MKAVIEQLVLDMKASWKKTAVLGALLLFGMCFWIPQLIGLFRDGKKKPPKPNRPAAAAKQPTASTSTAKTEKKKDEESHLNKFTWENVEEMLKTDPLTQSVPATAIASNPFAVDHDLFPPPLLFEPEPEGPPEKTAEQIAAESAAILKARLTPKTPQGLILKSIMIGSRVRAAFINKDLYFEGKKVEAKDGGEPYTLSNVYPRKVVLTRDLDVYELEIEDKNVGRISAKTTSAN